MAMVCAILVKEYLCSRRWRSHYPPNVRWRDGGDCQASSKESSVDGLRTDKGAGSLHMSDKKLHYPPCHQKSLRTDYTIEGSENWGQPQRGEPRRELGCGR